MRALQTEASVIGIYKGMPNYFEMIRHLGECGFDLSGLYPVGRDSSFRLVEFDCVMIKRQRHALTKRHRTNDDAEPCSRA